MIKAFETQQFELAVERAARQHHQADAEEKAALIITLKALVEKLQTQVADDKRTKFGLKSEKLTPDQMELALEDQEMAIAQTQAKIEHVQSELAKKSSDKSKAPPKPHKPRSLPDKWMPMAPIRPWPRPSERVARLLSWLIAGHMDGAR